MKKVKYSIFPIAIALLLTACGGNPSSEGGQSNQSSEAPKNENFTLIDPEDTSMVTAKVKAYVDAMREQEESLEDPYMLGDGQLGGEAGVTVENFLDEGEVEGQNRTVNGKIPNRSDRNDI